MIKTLKELEKKPARSQFTGIRKFIQVELQYDQKSAVRKPRDNNGWAPYKVYKKPTSDMSSSLRHGIALDVCLSAYVTKRDIPDKYKKDYLSQVLDITKEVERQGIVLCNSKIPVVMPEHRLRTEIDLIGVCKRTNKVCVIELKTSMQNYKTHLLTYTKPCPDNPTLRGGLPNTEKSCYDLQLQFGMQAFVQTYNIKDVFGMMVYVCSDKIETYKIDPSPHWKTYFTRDAAVKYPKGGKDTTALVSAGSMGSTLCKDIKKTCGIDLSTTKSFKGMYHRCRDHVYAVVKRWDRLSASKRDTILKQLKRDACRYKKHLIYKTTTWQIKYID